MQVTRQTFPKNNGTQFMVHLPATSEAVNPQFTELVLLSGQQELVLIVDDGAITTGNSNHLRGLQLPNSIS